MTRNSMESRYGSWLPLGVGHPVVRVAGHDELVARRVALEDERPGADRLGGHRGVGVDRVEPCRRGHHAPLPGEVGGEVGHGTGWFGSPFLPVKIVNVMSSIFSIFSSIFVGSSALGPWRRR